MGELILGTADGRAKEQEGRSKEARQPLVFEPRTSRSTAALVFQTCQSSRLHHPRAAQGHAGRLRQGLKEKGPHQEPGSALRSNPEGASGLFFDCWSLKIRPRFV